MAIPMGQPPFWGGTHKKTGCHKLFAMAPKVTLTKGDKQCLAQHNTNFSQVSHGRLKKMQPSSKCITLKFQPLLSEQCGDIAKQAYLNDSKNLALKAALMSNKKLLPAQKLCV